MKKVNHTNETRKTFLVSLITLNKITLQAFDRFKEPFVKYGEGVGE